MIGTAESALLRSSVELPVARESASGSISGGRRAPARAVKWEQTRNFKYRTLNMLVGRILGILLALLSVRHGDGASSAPQLVYGTYLGGRDKECATAIAVDNSGTAYVVGRTPSPDFPVTPGAFSTATRVDNNDWTGFVSKISERGDHLLYSSFIGGNFRSSADALAVDLAGGAFV